MIYGMNDSRLAHEIDRWRTGYRDDDVCGDEYAKVLPSCKSCRIEITEGKVFCYRGKHYCEECFRDALFDDYAEEYGMDIEDWEE